MSTRIESFERVLYGKQRKKQAGAWSNGVANMTLHGWAGMRTFLFIFLLGTAVRAATPGISYTVPGDPYYENFDGLARSGLSVAWDNFVTIPGWYAVSETGEARSNYRATDGTSPMGGRLVSVGRALVNPASDRAIGQQNPATNRATVGYIGVVFRNLTGLTLHQAMLSYTGELWRVPGVPNKGDQLFVEYQLFPPGGGTINATNGWIRIPLLTFVSPVPLSGYAQAYDGNNPSHPVGNQRGLSSGLALDWLPEQELWFRWSDANNPQNEHQHLMAIDDVGFSAHDTPPAPVIRSVSPNNIFDAIRQTVTVRGHYFHPEATVNLVDAQKGLLVEEVTWVDANTLTFSLSVEANAAAGPLRLVVINPSGRRSATFSGIFSHGPFVMRALSRPQVAAGGRSVLWEAMPGSSYLLEQAPDLYQGPWTTITGPIFAEYPLVTVTGLLDGASSAHFWRIRYLRHHAALPLHPLEVPDLVAFWDFQEEAGDRWDRSTNRFRLVEQQGPVPRIHPADGAPFGPYAARLPGDRYLHIPRSELGPLNIHGSNSQVTVIAWLRRENMWINAVAGIWNETRSKRQYALFFGILFNTQNTQWREERVSGHISQYGGPTPGQSYCYEVSLGDTPVPTNQWVCVAMTYDGVFARSWYNGAFDGENPLPARPYRMGNPYYAPLGIFDGGEDGADFTVGAVHWSGNMGSYFKGELGGLAVYNRALTAEEIYRLALPALALGPE
ncbi:MAG TPA: IPT/TIG domain-containing protein [Kiritimatiellia bacterium]|nr:IPT/TIG domain-containing protein [Kiritimatiellia bacterium]HMO98157.1 IPT/TIG domain-containing protein [Kiritimatiellia bacterium]